MQFIVDRNQEILGSFLRAMDELAVLRDNLLKKEQILAEMASVAEKKAPRQPRFVQPLQNAEIREGQRYVCGGGGGGGGMVGHICFCLFY